jgi:hypothetical protein
MTWKSKLSAIFPFLTILLTIISFITFSKNPSFLSFLLIPCSLYIFPLASYRIHNVFFPLKKGKSIIDTSKYSSWWGGHQIQLIYYACPTLEALLRVVPGVFSLWLRLWGSKVGKGVYWTPNVEIDDRGLVEIGDNVVFGHKIEIISHIVGPKKGGLSLYSQNVKIGKDCFIGAGSRLGPGAEIESGTFLPVLSDVYIDQYIPRNHNIRFKKPILDPKK